MVLFTKYFAKTFLSIIPKKTCENVVVFFLKKQVNNVLFVVLKSVF